MNNIEYAGYIQTNIFEGDPQKNLANLKNQIEELGPPAGSLLVLPELWTTGFDYSRLKEQAEWYSEAVAELTGLCRMFSIYLCGSLPFCIDEAESRYLNRACVVGPEGEVGFSDKQFVFPGEEVVFDEATNPPEVIGTDLGYLGCMVCYDLRFPNIARKLCQEGAAILLYCAEWPLERIEHWKALLQARAIENQVYVIGCNGIGANDGIRLGGSSMIISPDGEVLAMAGSSEAESRVVTIDIAEQDSLRRRFNSVARNPQKVSALNKIFVPDDCANLVQRKTGVGQKVVWVKIEQGNLGLEEMEVLASARAKGDVLIAGVDCARAAVIGSYGKLGIILKRYAALENIDAVFDLNLLTEESEKILTEHCEVLLCN